MTKVVRNWLFVGLLPAGVKQEVEGVLSKLITTFPPALNRPAVDASLLCFRTGRFVRAYPVPSGEPY